MMKNGFYKRAMAIAMCLAASWCCTVTAQPLQQGDHLPAKEYGTAINYTKNTVRFDQLGKPLVILEFWNTWCKACLQSLPQIDTLQKRFAKDVCFVLVSNQSRKEIQQFFTTHRKLIQPNVIYITGDSLLARYFPHMFVPHHVWLKNGSEVLASTAGYNTTADNITGYLNHKKTNLAPSKTYRSANWSHPLLYDEVDSSRTAFAYYSYLLPAIDSLLFTDQRQKKNGSKNSNRILLNKTSLLGLYLTAYNEGSEKYRQRLGNVELKVNDSSKYLPPRDNGLLDQWAQKNLYLYDLVVPPRRAHELYRIMQQDLLRMIGCKVRIEQRKMNCLVLSRTGTADYLRSSGDKPAILYRKPPYDSLWRFRNIPFTVFSARLQDLLRNRGIHYRNNTGYEGNVDIELKAELFDAFDLASVNSQLAKYGLVLTEDKCDVDVLVISEAL